MKSESLPPLPPRVLALERVSRTLDVIGQRSAAGPLRRGEVESAQTMLERISITLDRTRRDLEPVVPAVASAQLAQASDALASARAVIDGIRVSSWRLPPIGPLGSMGRHDVAAASRDLLRASDAVRGVNELVFADAARAAGTTPAAIRAGLLAHAPVQGESAVSDARAGAAALPPPLEVAGRAVVDDRRNGVSRAVSRILDTRVGRALGIRVLGADQIPAQGAFLLAPVHGSYGSDALVQIAATGARDVRSMAAQEAFAIPGAGPIARRAGVFPVERGNSASALRIAEEILRDGQALAIYPEGQVPRFDALAEPRMGAALLALRTGTTVIPMGSYGTRPSWVYGGRALDRLRGGTQAVAVVGDPISVAGLPADEANVVWLTERIHHENQQLETRARAAHAAENPAGSIMRQNRQ